MNEKISVIMSIYNENEIELKSSIESILNQTYKNIEFIIVIDNPIERWRIDFVKSYSDKRIKVIVNEKNIGLPKSLNIALKHATGSYVARMDADDISILTRLEKQYNFLKSTGYDMCGANVECLIDDEVVGKIIFPRKSANVKKMLFIKNCVSHPTFFAKKEVYDKLDGYSDIFSCEDYDFLLRAVCHDVLIGNVQEILLKYRINQRSISRLNAGKQELIAELLRKFYKKNKFNKLNKEIIDNYLMSKKFKKNINEYNYYWKMKNERSKYKRNKGIKYIFYTILLILDFKHSFKDIYIKLYEKKIIKSELKDNYDAK